MKVYPHRWQGANRPIVATYDSNGQKVPWLIDVDRTDGHITARCPGNGGTADERAAVAAGAVELYGIERLYAARGYQVAS